MKLRLLIWCICFAIFIVFPMIHFIYENDGVVTVITLFRDFPSVPLGGLIIWTFALGSLVGFLICLFPTVFELRSISKMKKQLVEASTELEKLREINLQSSSEAQG